MSANSKTIPGDVMKLLRNKFDLLRKLTLELYNIEVPKIYVKFDLETQRFLGSIGKHETHKGCFSARLNLDLLIRYREIYIDEVIVHEFAHAVTNLKYGLGKVRSHGKEWKSIARSLGQSNPKSTTSLFKLKRDYTYVYKCGCMTHYLSLRRHNKYQRDLKKDGFMLYSCGKCSSKLKFVSKKSS